MIGWTIKLFTCYTLNFLFIVVFIPYAKGQNIKFVPYKTKNICQISKFQDKSDSLKTEKEKRGKINMKIPLYVGLITGAGFATLGYLSSKDEEGVIEGALRIPLTILMFPIGFVVGFYITVAALGISSEYGKKSGGEDKSQQWRVFMGMKNILPNKTSIQPYMTRDRFGQKIGITLRHQF